MNNYKEALKELRKEPLSIRNRLNSILIDTMFVSRFAQSDLPVIANERCGLWYVKPDLLAESAYFKSTDGHTSQWKFSLRRLNLHLLPFLYEHGGIVVVDSTRKGKLMPDALLKTIPIWCAVLNYIMFESEARESELLKDSWLRTPRDMVLESEHSSISKEIPRFAAEAKRLGLITKEMLLERLGTLKPIVPSWRYPGQKSPDSSLPEECFRIMCVTALSTFIGSLPSWSYVQGAADDHELWATKDVCGGKLDALLFWHIVGVEDEEVRVVDPETGIIFDWLSESQLVQRMNAIYESLESDASSALDMTSLGDTGVLIGLTTRDLKFAEIRGFDAVVVLSSDFKAELPLKDTKGSTLILNYAIAEGKKGSKELREAIPKVMEGLSLAKRIAVFCNTGKDLSVAIALCVLCQRYNINWEPSTGHLVNKDVVKQHLQKISDYRKVNPSRNTLQSVNTYLIGR